MKQTGQYCVGDTSFDVTGEYTPALPPKLEGNPGHAGAHEEFNPEQVMLGDHDLTEAAHQLYVQAHPPGRVTCDCRVFAQRLADLAAQGRLTEAVACSYLELVVQTERQRWVPLIDDMASTIHIEP